MEIVKLLIENEASLESSNLELQTHLLAAASFGHLNIVRVLLQAGAYVDVQTVGGEILLTYAARWGLIGIAGMLL